MTQAQRAGGTEQKAGEGGGGGVEGAWQGAGKSVQGGGGGVGPRQGGQDQTQKLVLCPLLQKRGGVHPDSQGKEQGSRKETKTLKLSHSVKVQELGNHAVADVVHCRWQ